MIRADGTIDRTVAVNVFHPMNSFEDGADSAARPVATVPLPQRVPFGFHGSWIAD